MRLPPVHVRGVSGANRGSRPEKVRRHVPPAAAALTAFAAFGFAQPASAQGSTYCDGKLAADAFYSTTTSNGSQARVDHFLQLRNSSNQSVRYVVQFNFAGHPPVINRINATERTLRQYASERLQLGSQTTPNPSGSGAIRQSELSGSVTIHCR